MTRAPYSCRAHAAKENVVRSVDFRFILFGTDITVFIRYSPEVSMGREQLPATIVELTSSNKKVLAVFPDKSTGAIVRLFKLRTGQSLSAAEVNDWIMVEAKPATGHRPMPKYKPGLAGQCPRCKGNLVRNYDEVGCLQCGHKVYERDDRQVSASSDSCESQEAVRVLMG